MDRANNVLSGINGGLLEALIRARAEADAAGNLADSLAALVVRFITTLQVIRPLVGSGVVSLIDAAMAGVETPETRLPDSLAEVVEFGIDALFQDVASMDGFEVSPLELFRAQQTIKSAWLAYVNEGNDGQPA